MGGKKIIRDFIKGGRGGSPFYEVISKENFNFMEDGFPNAIVMLSMLLLHLLHSPSFSEECNNIGYVDIDSERLQG